MAKKRRRERTGKTAPSEGGGEVPRREVPRRDDGGAASPGVPLWVPAVLFVVLTVLLFRDFIFGNGMLFGGDTLGLGYVARDFYADALKELGQFPRWAPLILGGTPFVEALSAGDSLYPPSVLLLLLLETHRALGWKLVLHVAAAGFFMFGWIRTLGGSRAAALFAGTAYLVAPFLVTLVHPGHDGKLFVTALAPLLFWAVERHFARPGPAGFAGIGLVVSLVLLTTHFQMAYFLFGAVGMYAIFRAVQLARGGTEAARAGQRSPTSRAGLLFGAFLAASLLGAAGAAVQFWPAVDYVTEHSRRVQTTREDAGETGRAWSSSWSMHPEEAMGQLIPEFAGNDARGSEWTNVTYWGRNVTRDNSPYAGIIVLLLAAVSFAGAARRGVRWFFTGLGLVAFLFALGVHTPVWGLFYTFLPGISLFRAPDQVMFLFGFSAVTLAALGLDRVLMAVREDDGDAGKGVMRVLWAGAGAMVVLALLASSGALTSLWTSVVYSDIDAGRLQRLQTLLPYLGRGAWMGAFLCLGAAGLVWATRRRILPVAALMAGVVAMAALDGIRVDGSFIQIFEQFESWRSPDPNIQALQQIQEQDGEPFRLFSLAQAGQDVTPAMHGIELVAGHHPNDLSRYRELIGMVGSGFPENLADTRISALLNTRFWLWPDRQYGPPPEDAQIVSRTELGGQPYQTLLALPALPRARLLANAVVKSDDEAVPYMRGPGFDPSGEVVLAEEPPLILDGQPVNGTVTWEERTPNRLRWTVVSDRSALLIVADNWFPAWQATVDGVDTPVLRAYHALRAVPVPAGEHTVEMVYRSTVVGRSLWVSIVVLVLLVGTFVYGVQRERMAASVTATDPGAGS